MNVYGLMASIRVSSDKDSIAVIDEYVAERVASKDGEVRELSAENKRLREGLEEILRAQEYEGFLLVSPALVEKLLKNPAAGENPTSVDKNNS